MIQISASIVRDLHVVEANSTIQKQIKEQKNHRKSWSSQVLQEVYGWITELIKSRV